MLTPGKSADNQSLRSMQEVTRTAQLRHRQLFFWLGIAVFTAAIFLLIQYGRASYADEFDLAFAEGDTNGGITADLTLQANGDGRVFINNQLLSPKTFQPYRNFDEFKYKVVDKPGTFVDSLTARVVFENKLPAGTVLRSFAIHGIDEWSEERIDDHTLEFTAGGIGPEATLTIAAQLPKGSISWPLWRVASASIIALPISFWLTLAVILPLATLLVLVVTFTPVLRRLTVQPASPVSAPPQPLPAALVGILVHGRVSARELAATILDLAERGYLTVFNNDSTRFSFAKRRAWQGLQPFELLLLTQLFQDKSYKSSSLEIETKAGQTLFSPEIARVYVAMYDSAAALGYFTANPADLHRRYRQLGLFLFFVALLAFSFVLVMDLQPTYVLFLFASMMTTALIIIVAADEVPLLKPAGERARLEWLAFAQYLRSPELVGYTEGAQATYERFLPYAVVLGCEVEWVNRFRRHPFQLPSWYDAPEKVIPIEEFAKGLYRIVGAIANLFSSVKEPTVH